MRDFLAAIRERVVVFDGGMGATLEEFDLSRGRLGELAGKRHEALVLHRPDVIQGCTSRWSGPAPRSWRPTRSRPPAQARGVGPRRAHARDQPARPPRSRARRSARTASSRARSARPATSPPPTTRRSARSRFRELVEVFTEQAAGLVEGGADLLIIETAQDILEVKAAIFGAREAFKLEGRSVPIQTRSRLLPNGGKMLLGTDITRCWRRSRR